MKFKNYSKEVKRVMTLTGHCIVFQGGEECEVPKSLQDDCLASGLVPLDEVDSTAEQRDIELAEAEAEAQRIADEEEAIAEQEKAEALEKATATARAKASKSASTAKKAATRKRSEAAKKAAATKKAKLKTPAKE